MSSRMGGRGVLRRIIAGRCSDRGVWAREPSAGVPGAVRVDGVGAGRLSRSSSACTWGAAGGRGVDGRMGLAEMMMDAASIGRTGFGAISGGVLTTEIGSAGGAGSASVVAVAASRVFIARSMVRPADAAGSGIGSEAGILSGLSGVGARADVEGWDSLAGGSGRHSRLDF